MDIDGILNNYEEAKRLQEEARLKRDEQIALQRAAAREAIGTCLKTIIEPVLVEARDKLIARNHHWSVQYQQRVEGHGEGEFTWAIGIYIKSASGPFRAPQLLFMGNDKDYTIEVESDYGKTAAEVQKHGAVPLSSITKEFVDAQVSRYFAKIFQPPSV